jgi:hypothetical protein
VALPVVSIAASSPKRLNDVERTSLSSMTGSDSAGGDDESSSGCPEPSSRARFFARMRLVRDILGSTVTRGPGASCGPLFAAWVSRLGDPGFDFLRRLLGLFALVDPWSSSAGERTWH